MDGLEPDITILIANEDSVEVHSFLRALRTVRFRYKIRVVSNGQQVISYLSGERPFDDRTRFPMPDLLLLGLGAATTGSVLNWIKTQPATDGLEVVVFSATELEKNLFELTQFRAKHCRLKPNTPWGLAQAVRELTSKWLS